MTVYSIRSAKPRADQHEVLNWAQPAPLQAANLTTKRRPPVEPSAWRPAKSSASKPFTKFQPGIWTIHLLLLANPGMTVNEAGRHMDSIRRSHEAATRRKLASASKATRPAKAATVVVTGAQA